MGIRGRNKVSVSFSMSSMTDIVFLLLIFFILISTMITPNSIKVMLPKAGAPTSESGTVAVTINADGEYIVDNKNVDEALLEDAIIGAVADPSKNGVVLKPNPKTPTKYVVKVMDIASRNDIKIALTTRKQ